jgi:putative two-component system response regulator
MFYHNTNFKGGSVFRGRVTDVFDALTSERPYKKPWPVEKALDLLKEESGQHFDPKLVPAFLEVVPEVLKIKDQYAENQQK